MTQVCCEANAGNTYHILILDLLHNFEHVHDKYEVFSSIVFAGSADEGAEQGGEAGEAAGAREAAAGDRGAGEGREAEGRVRAAHARDEGGDGGQAGKE